MSWISRVNFTLWPPSLSLFSCVRHLSGSEGPCDEAHLPGSGPGRPPHWVERLAQTCRPTAGRPLPLQLLLPPDWRREGGSLCCRYSPLWPFVFCIDLCCLTSCRVYVTCLFWTSSDSAWFSSIIISWLLPPSVTHLIPLKLLHVSSSPRPLRCLLGDGLSWQQMVAY